MAKSQTGDGGAAVASRPQARLVKGFRDIEAAELRRLEDMIAKIRAVYERYGFEPLETPAFEYTDALGKFLPDQDRPNAGVFSLREEEVAPEGRGTQAEWMSLRYDLTAPLARYVAQNFERLPKPYRRYAYGSVYRNEKPGPGRYRQFTQFDADTVGTDNIAADAEMCMLAADTLEALGLAGKYVIKVNNRKVLDGVREALGLGDAAHDAKWLTVMRALDKYDRLGREGVRLLLGPGRTDESGDRTVGAGLDEKAIKILLQLLTLRLHVDSQASEKGLEFNPLILTGSGNESDDVYRTMTSTISSIMRNYYETQMHKDVRELGTLEAGLRELEQIGELLAGGSYAGRIVIDTSVIRGLEYYTGPVFEAELTFTVNDEQGHPVRFGSVGGGGRYDDLVARFTGEKVPATGFSIGVSRLASALTMLEKDAVKPAPGPVVVLVMDKPEVAKYQALTQTLRNAGIRAEMYLGTAGMKPQMKYADKRGAAVAVIQGSRERETGEVVLKDLIEGAEAAKNIKDNAAWKSERPAQVTVKEADLVAEVRKILARHTTAKNE